MPAAHVLAPCPDTKLQKRGIDPDAVPSPVVVIALDQVWRDGARERERQRERVRVRESEREKERERERL